MKIGSYEIPNRMMALVGILVVVIVAFAIMSCPKKPVVTTIPAINATQVALEKSLRKQIADKDTTIKLKESANKALQSRILVSDNRYKIIAAKYAAQQKEKENVKMPFSLKEMRDRFTAAGFPALPEGQCGAGTICFATGFK